MNTALMSEVGVLKSFAVSENGTSILSRVLFVVVQRSFAVSENHPTRSPHGDSRYSAQKFRGKRKRSSQCCIWGKSWIAPEFRGKAKTESPNGNAYTGWSAQKFPVKRKLGVDDIRMFRGWSAQ